MGQVFRHKNEILAPVHPLGEAQAVLPHHVPQKQLVPQYAVEEAVGVAAEQAEKFLLPDGAVLPGQAPVIPPVAGHLRVRGDDQIAAPGLHALQQRGHGIRRENVVRVHKADIRPLANLQGRVAGGGHAAVFLMDGADALILPGDFLQQGPGAVPAAVIHHQDLHIRHVLAQDAHETRPEKFLAVIHRHNHADQRLRHGSTQPSVALFTSCYNSVFPIGCQAVEGCGIMPPSDTNGWRREHDPQEC